jgi:hypothetical protein
MSYIGKQPTKAPLTASDIEDGIITAAKIEDGAVVAAEIASNAVTTAKINADAVTSAKIADNAVVTAAINADAVTGAKIADDAINSEHYTDGSIDTAHIADGQVTTAKLSTALFTGATDIGADIADADLFLMDDGAGGTIRKTAASRLKTYAGSAAGQFAFEAYRSGNLAVSATTNTELVFNAEVFDTGSKYNTSNGRYTPGVAGTYFVTSNVSFAPGSNVGVGSSMYLKIRKNNAADGHEHGQISNQGSGDSDDIGFTTSAVIELDDDDYISMFWYAATAGNLLSVQSWFSGFRIA